MKRFFFTYLDIASVVLFLNTVISLLDEHQLVKGKDIIDLPILTLLIFFYCFFNMFLLFGTGIISLLLRRNIIRSIIYICSALFFLFFFMGLSNWDGIV